MSKRRLKGAEEEEKAPEDLTPEERRSKRRRDRAQGSSGKNRRGFGSPLQRGAVIGGVAGVIVVILVLIVANPFHIGSPCLTLGSAPTQPYFPPAGTTNFQNTWCPPQGPTLVYQVEPQIKIIINGTNVALPADIGVNRSFGTYKCTLPVSTPSTASLGPGVIIISSIWQYSYNLTWFFQDWQATFGTVGVGTTHPSQPITYTSSNLLGFAADSTHAIHLFVDGHESAAGPTLILSTLPFVGTTFPGCIATVYGTGHTVLLTYGSTSGVATARPMAPVAGTATGPMVGHSGKVPLDPAVALALAFGTGATVASLAFLAMRVERR